MDSNQASENDTRTGPDPRGPDLAAARAQAIAQALNAQLEPWRQAVAHPAQAQEATLRRFLSDYVRTAYGSQHAADKVAEAGGASDAEEPSGEGSSSQLVTAYRQAFPIMTYEDYKPLVTAALSGETSLLLTEEPVGWAITRGTTAEEPKFIPMTPTDLRVRSSAGRAMMAYVETTQRLDLLAGVNLNLNFPSVVGTVLVGDKKIEYGYSSGIYAKYVARSTPIQSAPTQEEIDALGGGITRAAWDARFELALETCRHKNVTLVGGVCQTALEFGRYLRNHHRIYPKQLWDVQIMTLGSTPGINTRHAAQLSAMYGPVAVREIYGATEGMLGQQRDDRRAWVPNYDLFFFEVLTRSGVKMLHEMSPGETGSLVVSTPILARYRIGDIILALRPPYFRCIGRERWWTKLDYYWKELATFNLGRL
jgi:hypothetical protein